MIDTVVLDLGGVAARFHPERRLRALASLGGVSEEAIERRIFTSGFDDESELGTFSHDQVVAHLREALGYRGPEASLVDAWALAFEPDQAVGEYLNRLSVRKALFTNNGPVLDACLEGPLRELAASFDDVICSWHLGARKPDGVAFARAAARLGSPPERLLLFDDSPTNVKGARDSGWNAECVSGADALIAAAGKRRSLRSEGL